MIALSWPGPTALVLVLLIGIWAGLTGLVMIVGAFQKGEPAGTRALLILSGLALIVFGVLLCAHPGIGAVTIALLFNLFLGISSIVAGIELRRTGKTLDSMMQPPGGMQKPGGAQQQPVTS